jgi:predicted permease
MSMWSRVRNVFRPGVTDDVDEELRLHLEEAIASGRDPDEVRRALGSTLRLREESRDARVIVWLDAIRADVIFATRQIQRHAIASIAAVLSLGLALGACTAAFRVADALLWRPLPIAHPDRLHVMSLVGTDPSGRVGRGYSWAYPQFALMRDAVAPDALLLAASQTQPLDVLYDATGATERVTAQFVSGTLFPTFGLTPAVGRLLTPSDDMTGEPPRAVLSGDYWRARFGADPSAVGRLIDTGRGAAMIVGVVDGPFSGTEPGTPVDVFLPTSFHPNVARDDSTWLRVFVELPPGAAVAPVRDRARAVWRAYEAERLRRTADMPSVAIDQVLNLQFDITASPGGSSRVSSNYALPLAALGVMVALVMLIASGNVANLRSAQATSRRREMALRASIGAGRARLVQLVVVEGAVVAAAAVAIGAVFAAWAAPFVVSHVNPPENPARLWLPLDGRVTAFGVLLAVAVTGISSLGPALAVSRITPLSAVRGATNRHTSRPIARALIGAQVAFCAFVLVLAGLSVTTFQRLAQRPLGFSPENVTVLNVSAASRQPGAAWTRLRDAIAQLPGSEAAALAGWPMLQGSSWNGFVSVDGASVTPVLGEFLNVSPEFMETMKIGLVAGRALTSFDRTPGQAIVNETFVRVFLGGVPSAAAIERRFAKGDESFTIVGVMRDAVYRDVHAEVSPLAFVPFARTAVGAGAWQLTTATLVIRWAPGTRNTVADWPQTVRSIAPEFRVTSVRTQQSVVDAQMVRERLLALLAAFFGVVALALTGIGLYGLLHFAVVQRRREIGIRRAIGATAARIVTGLSAELAGTIAAGLAAGLAAGYAGARALDGLFYGVRPGDVYAFVLPAALMIGTALVAGITPAMRALRIHPVEVLRAD